MKGDKADGGVIIYQKYISNSHRYLWKNFDTLLTHEKYFIF